MAYCFRDKSFFSEIRIISFGFRNISCYGPISVFCLETQTFSEIRSSVCVFGFQF